MLNPDNEFYARANEQQVYDQFRQTIREREAFNREEKQIKLNN